MTTYFPEGLATNAETQGVDQDLGLTTNEAGKKGCTDTGLDELIAKHCAASFTVMSLDGGLAKVTVRAALASVPAPYSPAARDTNM